jgi:hypothetical protein
MRRFVVRCGCGYARDRRGGLRGLGRIVSCGCQPNEAPDPISSEESDGDLGNISPVVCVCGAQLVSAAIAADHMSVCEGHTGTCAHGFADAWIGSHTLTHTAHTHTRTHAHKTTHTCTHPRHTHTQHTHDPHPRPTRTPHAHKHTASLYIVFAVCGFIAFVYAVSFRSLHACCFIAFP